VTFLRVPVAVVFRRDVGRDLDDITCGELKLDRSRDGVAGDRVHIPLRSRDGDTVDIGEGSTGVFETGKSVSKLSLNNG